MKKYEVHGTVTVYVTKEVWANNEDEAIEKAESQLCCLTEYVGNGGWDKLCGVDGVGESISACDDIDYTDAEMIEDDPDYFECPNCDDQCDKETDDDGVEYWRCGCGACWDDDGDEFCPEEED